MFSHLLLQAINLATLIPQFPKSYSGTRESEVKRLHAVNLKDWVRF